MVSVSITSVSAGKLGDSKAGLSSYTCTQVPGALIYCVCVCVCLCIAVHQSIPGKLQSRSEG